MSDALVAELHAKVAILTAELADLRAQLTHLQNAPRLPANIALLPKLDARLSQLEEVFRRWREDDRYSITRAQVIRAMNEVTAADGNPPHP